MDKSEECKIRSQVGKNHKAGDFKDTVRLYWKALKFIAIMPIAIPVAACVLVFFGWVMNTAHNTPDSLSDCKEQE